MLDYASPADVMLLFAALFALAAGVGMLTSPRHYEAFADELERSSGLVIVSGVLTFLIGTLFLSFQGGRAWPSSIVAGLIGWFSIAEGVFLLAFPDVYRRLVRRVVMAGRVRAMGAVAVALGGLCLFLVLL